MLRWLATFATRPHLKGNTGSSCLFPRIFIFTADENTFFILLMRVDFFSHKLYCREPVFSDPAVRLLAEKPIRWASGNHCTSVVCLGFLVENRLLDQSHGKC